MPKDTRMMVLFSTWTPAELSTLIPAWPADPPPSFSNRKSKSLIKLLIIAHFGELTTLTPPVLAPPVVYAGSPNRDPLILREDSWVPLDVWMRIAKLPLCP